MGIFFILWIIFAFWVLFLYVKNILHIKQKGIYFTSKPLKNLSEILKEDKDLDVYIISTNSNSVRKARYLKEEKVLVNYICNELFYHCQTHLDFRSPDYFNIRYYIEVDHDHLDHLTIPKEVLQKIEESNQ